MNNTKYKSFIEVLMGIPLNFDNTRWSLSDIDLQDYGKIIIEDVLATMKDNHIQQSQIDKIRKMYL